jgi:hypothetical protein
MKITIDTEEKIIEVHKECNLLELMNSLHKILGDKIQDFKLSVKSDETYPEAYIPFQSPATPPFNGR